MTDLSKKVSSVDEVIALLQFAVNNSHNFTENDPDGVKRSWVEKSRKVLADLPRSPTETLLYKKVVKELGYGMNMPNETDVAFMALWVSRRVDGSLSSSICNIEEAPLSDELRERIATELRDLAEIVCPTKRPVDGFPRELECPECGAITFPDHETSCSFNDPLVSLLFKE